jgi:DNA mismatch repair protein MSH3
VRRILKRPSLKWTSVSGDEVGRVAKYLLNSYRSPVQYLVEIDRTFDQKQIPADWIAYSSTKKVRRYRTPVARRKLEERARFIEERTAAGNKAFASFLGEIAQEHYAVLRDAVNKLAVGDCLSSLATVAVSGKFVKPEFVDGDDEEDDVLEIVEGRHPMIETLRSDPFVPNSLDLGGGGARCKVITGPNMGGKSSTVRMVALIAIMAQIGSYVPAQSVRLSMLDGVLTRMGGTSVCLCTYATSPVDGVCSVRRAYSRAVDVHGRDVRDERHPTPSEQSQPGHS